MQKNNRFFDDIAKLASSAAGSVMETRKEFEEMIASQLEKLLHKMNLVTREEFASVEAMASNARKENENLTNKLDELAKRLTELEAKKNLPS